jgi:hypothetical protein
MAVINIGDKKNFRLPYLCGVKFNCKMEISQAKREIILRNAEILLGKTELLIETCNGWLSPEEGLENVAKRISDRDKAKRKNGFLARIAGVVRLQGIRIRNK